METHPDRRRPPRFELHADVLCLDFVNTLDDRPSEKPKELLRSYIDLARFGEDTGILEETRAIALKETLAWQVQKAMRKADQQGGDGASHEHQPCGPGPAA